MSTKLRLPDLSGIQVDYISDADEGLANFLELCTPAHIKLLTINYSPNSSIWINSKYYINAFSEAAARTTKEVYFSCIDFSAEDLQTVVRAAHNAERIVFWFCCIHCSPGLDFGTDLNYKTKFLSFQQWGSKYFDNRTTDWKEDPSSFSLIVGAIDSSGLRASLQKLSIAYNETLSASKVQEELNSKGMSHISVVQEWVEPLSI